MTTKPLDVLVGRFIHHCGGLELLVNGAIMALSSDAVLASEATRAPLARRISLLRRLLADRTDLPEEDVKSLCDELDEIRVKRNLVAHNPIASKEPHADAPEAILVVDYRLPSGESVKDITSDEVAEYVVQSNALLRRFAEMVPEATHS